MTVGTPFKHSTLDERYDAIVIGSGIGGLTTAALLARHANKRVLVLEKHYTAGGFTHAFRRPGFEWDVGVHYIGDVLHPKAQVRRVFDHITDGALGWADMGEVYDTVVLDDGERFPLRRGRGALRDDLVARFPTEASAIDAYFALVERAVKSTRLFFAEKAIPTPIAFVLGGLMRRRALSFTRRTTREVLESLTSNQKLIALLTAQWGDYGLPPSESSFLIHATVVNHYLSGAAYPVGGAGRIAETIAPLIEAGGGQIVTSAEVTEILVEGGAAVGVRLPSDRVVRAPIVVSAAGVALTYGRLLSPEARARVGLRDSVTHVPPSIAHLSLYVGLDQTAEELGFTKSNIWVLGGLDHDAAVRETRAHPDGPIRHAYLSFPSAKDPDFLRRYPGKATAEIITFIPFEAFSKWEGSRWGKRGEDYDAFKTRLSERLLEHLYREHPSTRGHVVHAELSTPLTTKHFAAHPKGEIYGLAHTPRRFEDRALKPATKIRGLYLSGADVCSAGVAGAMIGGVLTASAITRRNVLASALRGAQPEERR